MKKYILMLAVALSSTIFVGCDPETDEEAGGTAVEKMAGTWTVTFEQSVDEYNYITGAGADPNLTQMTPEELDKQEWADIYGKGKLTVMSSNTAANVSTEMWLIDNSFQGTKIKCDVDYAARTFKADAQTVYDGCEMQVIGGKVLEGAATTPRGVPADSIVAYVKYSDEQNGFTYMKMSGYRYTGYTQDQ